MLELRGVTKTFWMGQQEVSALKDIHLTIAQGELLALVGPSGSGKSTLMNIMGLLDRPTTGEHLWNGEVVSAADNRRRTQLRNQQVGFIFQSFMLLPRFNALQNVSLPLFYRGMEPAFIKERAMRLLEKVGLASHWHHRPSELSGGQQQRVAIARALVGSPRVILADEPTGALDSQTGSEVLALLKQAYEEEQATVVVITHDRVIAQQCRRIVPLRDGRMVEA